MDRAIRENLAAMTEVMIEAVRKITKAAVRKITNGAADRDGRVRQEDC